MAVKIWNRTSYQLVVPGVGGRPLGVGEAREYEGVEYDDLINRGSIQTLLKKQKIKLQNLDDLDVRFAGEWNNTPHLTLGEHEYWIDANGDTRVVEGTPTSDTDGEVLGGGAGALQYEPIYMDEIRSFGRTFAQMRASFFNFFTNQSKGTWDVLYKYCYWRFTWDSSEPWGEWQKFDTEDDLFTYLEATIPSSGGAYTPHVIRFQTYEEVDTQDPFPMKVVHRNSLVASMMGRGNYTSRQPLDRYGVSSTFDAPSYYINFYGELAQRFVQADTGTLPGTNNNGAVWYTNRTRSYLNFPKIGIGSAIQISLPGSRGAVWDTVGLNWVSPAPTGSYTIQQPFLLMEWSRNKQLQIVTSPSSATWGMAATRTTAALVFPVVNGQYRAYAVYAYGHDTFATESIDTGIYELTIKCQYRHAFAPIYHTISDPWYTYGADGEHMMWSHWKVIQQAPLAVRSILYERQPESTGRNPDSNTYPEKVYLARRNKETGVRSSWYPLYSIRRRIPHAAYMIEPAAYQK